jgi:hypothetical protein
MPEKERTMDSLELTCIKPFTQSRRVFSSVLTIDLDVGDIVTLALATNLPDSEGCYWVMAVNDDHSYGENSYGYLIELEDDEKQEYFEE